MSARKGGLNLPLLEELLAAGAGDAVIREEGYTYEEATRARVASSLRSTSDPVSIGPESPAKHSRLGIGQPRRGEPTGPMPGGLDGAPEHGPGPTVAPRGGIAGHRHDALTVRPG